MLDKYEVKRLRAKNKKLSAALADSRIRINELEAEKHRLTIALNKTMELKARLEREIEKMSSVRRDFANGLKDVKVIKKELLNARKR